jgi:chromosome partitioning protein
MRRIAVINQKGGVGKTTTAANLGAALAEQGRRVVLVDLDAQGNLTTHLGLDVPCGEPSIYTVLIGETSFAAALRETSTPGLSLVPSNIDLSGAELELASALGRETLLREAIDSWRGEGEAPADYVIFDCPPSLGLLSINGLTAAREVELVVQTEYLALQGMSKLVDVVQLLRKRMNPELAITGIIPCLYDARLRLAREVLAEIRRYFPGEVFKTAIRANVKLAEAPSFGEHIFQYAPSSNGAADYRKLALEVISQESADAELAHLPAAKPADVLVKEARARMTTEPVVELQPKAQTEAENSPPGGAVRAEDLPPLPTEAFGAPAEAE